jgi:hypothetical protein
VDGEQLIRWRRQNEDRFVQLDSFGSSAALETLLAPGVFDQDAAHGFGGGGEEVSTVLPVRGLGSDQPQPGFVHECCGLQGMSSRFGGHPASGELAQLLIDDGQQFLGGFGVALLHGPKYPSDIVHTLLLWLGCSG